MGLERTDLQAISSKLIPLIAHDHAGFGGGDLHSRHHGAFASGVVPSRSLWQILCLAGTIGFVAAIGVHPAVGYNDLIHLAPALIGFAMFIAGLILCWRPMQSR